MVAISFGLLGATLLLLVYFLVDCRGRDVADFPALIYGGTKFSQRSVKKIWTWFLVVSFILGVSFSHQIWSDSDTLRNVPLPFGAKNYSERLLFHSSEVRKINDEEVYRKRALSIPLLFFVGLYFYHRMVRKWPEDQEGSRTSMALPDTEYSC